MASESPRRNQAQLPGGCLALFGLPFLAGGLFLAWMYFSGIAKWWDARSWVETPCRVLVADLKERQGDDSTSYEAVGRYAYDWQGRGYESERILLMRGGDGIGSFQQGVYRDMREAMDRRGGAFRCYVNPADARESVMMRGFRVDQTSLIALFCALFPVLGLGVSAGGVWLVRTSWQRKRLMREHPDEPWKWKPEWNRRPMPESGQVWRGFGRMLAIWWLLVTLPVLVTALASGEANPPAAWWLLAPGVFFVIATLMLAHGVREWMRIGRMALEMDLPLRPGQEIRGSWLTGKALLPRDVPMMKVVCRRTVTTRIGGKTSTYTDVPWEREEGLSVIDQSRELDGFRLPFHFTLPASAMESGHGEDDTSYEWVLEFRIEGSPVKARFVVPVYRRPGDPAPVLMTGETIVDAEDAAKRLPELLAKARLDAEFDMKGRLLSLRCTPRRMIQSILFLLLFNLIWTAAAVFLVLSDAPMIFKIFWPVSAAGIWLMVVYQATSRQELIVDGDRLRVSSRWLLQSRTESIPVRDVVEFSHSSNMRVNQTAYYTLKAVIPGGGKKTLLQGIAGESAALGLKRHLELWKEAGDG